MTDTLKTFQTLATAGNSQTAATPVSQTATTPPSQTVATPDSSCYRLFPYEYGQTVRYSQTLTYS